MIRRKLWIAPAVEKHSSVTWAMIQMLQNTGSLLHLAQTAFSDMGLVCDCYVEMAKMPSDETLQQILPHHSDSVLQVRIRSRAKRRLA